MKPGELIKCRNCGASVPWQEGPLVCSYCHASMAPAVVAPRASAASAPGPGSSGGVARVAGALVVLAAAGGAAWLFLKKDPPPPRPVMPVAISPATPAPAPAAVPEPTPAPPATARPLLRFGEAGAGPGMFTDARRIAVGQDGTIYVGESSTGHIQVFDPAGGFKRMIELAPDALTKQVTLFGMATDLAGHLVVNRVGDLLVLDAADGRVVKTIRGDYPETWFHGDLAIDASNRIHALADRTGRVDLVVLDARGKEVTRRKGVSAAHVAVDGDGRVQLSERGPIATDGEGRTLVEDHGGIDVRDPGGDVVAHLDVPGIRDFVVAGGFLYVLHSDAVVAKYALALPER